MTCDNLWPFMTYVKGTKRRKLSENVVNCRDVYRKKSWQFFAVPFLPSPFGFRRTRMANKLFAGLSLDFLRNFACLCFSPPEAMTPKTHEPRLGKFCHPPNPRTIPDICSCLCAFLSPKLGSHFLPFILWRIENGSGSGILISSFQRSPDVHKSFVH